MNIPGLRLAFLAGYAAMRAQTNLGDFGEEAWEAFDIKRVNCPRCHNTWIHPRTFKNGGGEFQDTCKACGYLYPKPKDANRYRTRRKAR